MFYRKLAKTEKGLAGGLYNVKMGSGQISWLFV